MDSPRKNPKEILEEMIYGKTELRKREREADLEHERKLAAIRAESPTLPKIPPVSLKVDMTTAPRKLTATIINLAAARKMEAYIQDHGIGQTEFANAAQTTDRTLRSFRKTGKVRRDIFEGIAKAMGITKDELMGE